MSKPITNDNVLNEAWSLFKELITSDEDAADYIFQSLLQDNKINCMCGNPQILHQSGERYFRCLSCRREVYFTAGTLFAGASRLRAWLAAVLFQEWGIVVSSLRLSRLLDIAQSTALNINKKVSIAIVSKMNQAAQKVDARRFSEVIFRRSRHTPADEHPRSELNGQPSPEAHSPEADNSESNRTEPKNPDSESGSANSHCKANTASNFSLSSSTQQLTMSMVIASAIAFIRLYFHGVSHKYLQLYVGAFWCHRDRETWGEGSVLTACLNHPPISYLDLLHYQAPDLRMMLT